MLHRSPRSDASTHIRHTGWRRFIPGMRLWLFSALLLTCVQQLPAAVSLLDTYYSPKNPQRAKRTSTRYIILHTTEGACKGSGRKLAKYGEAHYMIDTEGRIYRIIDRWRVAYHCGRSMWEGRTSLDACSVGIEMVGNHNRDLTSAQYTALRALLVELKQIYKIPDKRILTHSMIAYGAPNRWHKRSHRGRKRCGMRMATSSVRARLGIYDKPSYDPDVKSKRLVIADPALHKILYGRDTSKAITSYSDSEKNVIGPGRSAWDVARDAYNSADTIYLFPNGTNKNGKEINNWHTIPSGTQVVIDQGDNPVESIHILKPGQSPAAIAGAEWNSSRTLYLLPKGTYTRGDELTDQTAARMPVGTKVLAGYKIDGPITGRRPAFDVCGTSWNQPDTYFLYPDGSLVSGDTVNPAKIPRNTMVIFKN